MAKKKMTTSQMERFLLTLTTEAKQAIDVARGSRQRCEFIEDVLWNSRVIKSAAQLAGIDRVERRKQGQRKNV